MKRLLAITVSLLFAAIISASAADTPAPSAAPSTMHSKDSMTAGSHMMPGMKSHMSDRMMPSQSRHCTEEALAKMPPDHRAACKK